MKKERKRERREIIEKEQELEQVREEERGVQGKTWRGMHGHHFQWESL